MPKSDFYAGLPLAEQLDKLVDHHHDPQVRHISAAEADILRSAAARLKVGVRSAQRRREFDEVWRQLDHLYETTIHRSDPDQSMLVLSVPLRGRVLPEDPAALDIQVIRRAAPTARSTQLALNLMLRRLADPALDLESEWETAIKRRSPPSGPDLDETDNALLNRALYQPTVAVEESPPTFTTLAAVVAESGADDWLALAQEATGDPITIMKVGGVLLLLKTVAGPATALSEGLKERLYQWSRPSNEEAADGKDESPAPPKKPKRKGERKQS